MYVHYIFQEEVRKEINDLLGTKTEPSYNDLQELPYTERVIKEALRLYPSVPFIARLSSEDFVTHTGYSVPKDTIVNIHIYDLHRNPTLYPDPLKFDPDRFLPENCLDRHPFAYLPFSAGPRNCIGKIHYRCFLLFQVQKLTQIKLAKLILDRYLSYLSDII